MSYCTVRVDGIACCEECERSSKLEEEMDQLRAKGAEPVDMILRCPDCNARHIDTGEFETKSHHTHACQSCGMVWRPAVVPTRGVQFLPGFKSPDPTDLSESRKAG